MTNLNLNTSGMDVPPAYSQITNQPGQNIPRPSSPAPSYHTIDIIRSDQAARPDSSGSESVRTSENHLGRLRRVWRTWKQAGTFGTNVEGRIEYTVIHHAARSGSVENLSRLLRQSGLQIDAQTASGRSPLHVAIMADKPAEKRRTQAFLEAGANPKLVGERGLNALQLASFYGRGAVVALLLDQRYTMDVDATVGGDVGPNTEDIDGNLGNMTAVELAARQGHIHVVSLLLDHGASPGSAGRTTVLHEAASWGQTEVVSMLLERQRSRVDGNLRNHQGWTALDCALGGDRGETARVLLQQGGLEMALLDKEKEPGHPATLLYVMARLACVSVVTMLLQLPKYKKEVNTLNCYGLAPLHVAAEQGSVEILRCLLEHGADPRMTAGNGWSALHFAAQRGREGAVAALLRVIRWEGQGLDPTNKQGPSPLHLAVLSKNKATVDLLLRHGWPIYVGDHRGQTPLHHASAENSREMVNLLLQRGANSVAQDEEFMTPFLLAAEAGHIRVMRRLFDTGRDAPLHLPSQAKRKPHPVYWQILFPFLLKQGNRLNELVDGRTVLHHAAQCGHSQVAQLVLQHGARPSIRIKDRAGRTPAQVAAEHGHLSMVYMLDWDTLHQVERLIHDAVAQRKLSHLQALISAAPAALKERAKAMAITAAALTQQEQLITALVKHGASIDSDQWYGWSPLFVATLRGQQEAVQLLLTHGANPNLKSKAGITPLLQAAQGGYPRLILLLVHYGAYIEEGDSKGHTPLHVATRSGQEQVVIALLEAGANAHARGPDGQTALDFALDNKAEIMSQIITSFLAQREKNTSCRSVASLTLHLFIAIIRESADKSSS